MPDTLLARVADGRDVTLSGFHSAWRQVKPPDRPDSLTPQGARKFLDLLIDKEALGEVALQESWHWTARESADYNATRDGLTMKVVLDSVLARTRASLQRAGYSNVDTLGTIPLGIAARESAAVALGVRFDEPLVLLVTKAFAAIPKPEAESTVMAQLRVLGTMPVVDTALFAKRLAESRRGPLTVADLLASWQALSPVYRPRVEKPDDMRDVIENQFFERSLRAEVERRKIPEWPPIASTLARKREYFAVTHLVEREVYAKIAMDSVTLYRHYLANKAQWDLPFRIALARFVVQDEAAGVSMAKTLSNAADAESLIARGARAGVRYVMEVSAESDSTLFARAMRAGPGRVIGPEKSDNAFEVIRVLAVMPGRSRSFAECRRLVGHHWYGLEGERLMVELMARCRSRTRVSVNEQALARLTSP